MGLFSNSVPELNLGDAEKNEEWHKKFVQGIVSNAIGGGYEMAYTAMQESYDYYDGTQKNEEYNFLQESENGDILPAVWINYNKIRTKVDTLIGELSSKGFSVKVRAENKEAVSNRLEKKFEMLAQMNIYEDLVMLEEQSGVPTAPTEYIPDSKEELEDYINNTYKDNSEKIMEASLRYLIKRYKWEAKRLQLFRDIVITSRCFAKVEIENGMPKYYRVDPRNMIFDTSSKDDFLSDSTYFGEISYMSLADAKTKFHLTKKEIEEIEDFASGGTGSFGSSFGNKISKDVNLSYTEGSGNSLRVLVVHAEWQDTKKFKRKRSEDKFGNVHYKKVKDKYKGKDCIQKDIKIWRKGTLIGGQVMRDWGIRDNFIRSVDDIYDTKSSYISLCHNWVNNQTISKVDMLKGLNDLKNTVMHNFQLAINTSGTKGFFYDISAVPEGWNLEEVMYYLKSVGIAVYNSQKDGVSNPGRSFQEFDMTLSNSISQYINISRMIDMEMNEISGVNSERQGGVTSSSQAVGVTQSAIMASQSSTQPMFDAFNTFSEEVMSQLGGLVKIAFSQDKEIFSPIVGDAGVDFLNQDIDMHLNDYGVFIDVVPPALAEMGKIEQFTMAALSSGKIEIEDALMMIRETSGGVDLAIDRLNRAIKKRAEENAMQQEQQQEMQAALDMQRQQQEMQGRMQEIQAIEHYKGQRLYESSEQGHQNRVKEGLVKARTNN